MIIHHQYIINSKKKKRWYNDILIRCIIYKNHEVILHYINNIEIYHFKSFDDAHKFSESVIFIIFKW